MASVKSTLAIFATPRLPHGLNFSRASTATRINVLGLVESVSTGTIRYDFDPTTFGLDKGWLLEESTTNLCLQSEDFGNASWTKTKCSATANNAKSPDGTQNADSLSASNTATETIFATQALGSPFSNNQKYTVSVWAKANGENYLEISDKEDATNVTYAQTFNLSNGTLGTSGGTVDNKTITKYANDWYRCTVSFTASATTGSNIYLKPRSSDGVSNTSPHTAGQGVCLWGAQIEAKSYATSYVPTTTNDVQRAADVAYIEETNPCWNWDVGTSIFVQATPLDVNGTNQPVYHYQDGDNKNFITLLTSGDIKVYTDMSGTSTNQLASNPFDTGFTNTDNTSFHNMLSIQKDRLHMAQNGALSANLPDTSVTVPLNTSSHTYSIKFFHGTGLTAGSGWLKSFAIWSTPVDDITLQNDTLRGSVSHTLRYDERYLLDSSVTTSKLADDSVTGAKIPNNAITSAHLALDVIVAEDIANNAITFAELNDNAVIGSKIATNAVDGTKIAMGSDAAGDIMYYDGTDYIRLAKGTNGEQLTLAGGVPTWAADNPGATNVGGDLSGTVANAQVVANAITSTELANNSVTGTHIQLGSDAAGDIKYYDGTDYVRLGKGTVGHVLTQGGSNAPVWAADSTNVGGTAVGGDLSGTVSNAQITAGAVGSAEIAANAVTDTELASNAVTTIKITDLNVTEAKLAAGAVTNAKLGPDAVDGAKIADDAVDSEHYVDGSIDTAHIGDLQVTGGKIAANTIPAGKFVTQAINTNDIAMNAITTVKIADNNVNGAKIAMGGDQAGDIMYHNGTDYVRLAKGTAGQVLTVNSGATAPEWAADSTNVGNTAVGGDVTGTVSNITIPAGAITSAMLGVNVILAEDIAANAVTVAELATNAVETIKIKDGAVTGPKIAMGSDARGDIMYHNGTSYVRLPKGTNGQVLKMGANDPAWGADIDTTIGDAAVGGNVSGTISNITINAGVVTPTMLSAGGTANNTTFLRGDGLWATPTVTETDPTAVTMAIALG